MMKSIKTFVVTGVALYALQVSLAVTAQPTLSDPGKSAIAQIAVAATNRGDVPGVVTLIANRDGVIYQGAAGKQDVGRNVAMPPDAIFRIASMTKPVTSVAIMMLLDAGKLNLDDPVTKYLPEFEGRPVVTKFNPADATYETRPAKSVMTIRHLMEHTSGLGYSFTDPTIKRITDVTKKNDPDLPLMQDPGTKWLYSSSTRVLGWIVEKISGEKLDVFLQRQIFDPLKMVDTSYAVPANKVSRVVTMHNRTAGKLVETANAPDQSVAPRGDGGLYSTVQDYSMFVRMFLNGGTLNGVRFLSAKSLQLMVEDPPSGIIMQTQPDADPVRTRPFPIGAGKDKFGLGFQITAADPQYAQFRSPGTLSWGGLNNTHFWIDPKRQIAGIVMMQVLPFYDEASMGVLRGIEAAVYKHLN
jgi:methyl acetate hydrolase